MERSRPQEWPERMPRAESWRVLWVKEKRLMEREEGIMKGSEQQIEEFILDPGVTQESLEFTEEGD